MPCGRDVCFASDVRFARVKAEYITSLCGSAAKHHSAAGRASFARQGKHHFAVFAGEGAKSVINSGTMSEQHQGSFGGESAAKLTEGVVFPFRIEPAPLGFDPEFFA